MLFRNVRGELINIKKTDFVNDKLYYKSIMELKRNVSKLQYAFQNKNKQKS